MVERKLENQKETGRKREREIRRIWSKKNDEKVAEGRKNEGEGREGSVRRHKKEGWGGEKAKKQKGSGIFIFVNQISEIRNQARRKDFGKKIWRKYGGNLLEKRRIFRDCLTWREKGNLNQSNQSPHCHSRLVVNCGFNYPCRRSWQRGFVKHHHKEIENICLKSPRGSPRSVIARKNEYSISFSRKC